MADDDYQPHQTPGLAITPSYPCAVCQHINDNNFLACARCGAMPNATNQPANKVHLNAVGTGWITLAQVIYVLGLIESLLATSVALSSGNSDFIFVLLGFFLTLIPAGGLFGKSSPTWPFTYLIVINILVSAGSLMQGNIPFCLGGALGAFFMFMALNQARQRSSRLE